jgi:hypothetical protein
VFSLHTTGVPENGTTGVIGIVTSIGRRGLDGRVAADGGELEPGNWLTSARAVTVAIKDKTLIEELC